MQSQLATLLAPYGFDLVGTTTAQAYNACRASAQVPELPTFGRDDTTCFVIGNSRALWGPFLQHLRARPSALEAEAPLDDYARAVVLRAVTQACQDCRTDVRFSSTLPGAEGFADLLRAADCAGLAYLDNDLHLCLHPTYGPWIGLRAVVVVDAPAGTDVGRPLPDPIPADLRVQLQAAMDKAMEEVRKQAEAMEGVRSNWEVWAGIRRLAGDVFAPGAEYCREQLAYHYTSDKGVLREAVGQAAGEFGQGC